MSDRREDELDPELSEWLAGAREEEPLRADYDAMLAGVEAQIAEAERAPTFWLRTRSTLARRLLAAIAALVVVLVGGVLLTRRELGAIDPVELAIAVGALGALLGLSVHHALRPLHRPPLSVPARAATIALTLVATFVLALLPPHDHAELASSPGGLLDHVSPCLFYGLLTGLPVYLVLRLLHRGPSAASLLAACAAGLAGNLVLSLHCPSSDPTHLMLGHFMVALLFVGGLAAVHLLARARER